MTSYTTCIAEDRLPGLAKDLEPELPGYQTLKEWYTLLYQSITDSSFKEEKVTSPLVSNTNKPLLNRLYYLGITDSLNEQVSYVYLKSKIRSAQRLFNLTDDGILGKATMEVLNIPLAVRMEELRSAMNSVRWLRCIGLQSPVFVVNIPSANLLVLHKGQVLLQSKVIVGKRSTPTPTLASMITDVVLYPYCNCIIQYCMVRFYRPGTIQ